MKLHCIFGKFLRDGFCRLFFYCSFNTIWLAKKLCKTHPEKVAVLKLAYFDHLITIVKSTLAYNYNILLSHFRAYTYNFFMRGGKGEAGAVFIWLLLQYSKEQATMTFNFSFTLNHQCRTSPIRSIINF